MAAKKTVTMTQEDLENLKQDLMKDMKKEQPVQTPMPKSADGGVPKSEVKTQPTPQPQPKEEQGAVEKTPEQVDQEMLALHDDAYFRYLLLRELRYIHLTLRAVVENDTKEDTAGTSPTKQ